MRKKFLILGSGYSAQFLKPVIASKDCDFFETRRQSGFSSMLEFDLNREDTWKNLPSVDGSFWMFPAEPVAKVEKFLTNCVKILGKIVAVGSTGSFEIEDDSQIIDENSKLKSNESRVLGENEIQKRGGLIVRAAGIYGPGRDPRRWTDPDPSKNTEKWLNFIHAEDLAGILWKAMESNFSHRGFLAADGNPQRWATPSKRPSKKIDSRKSLHDLGVELKFVSVLEGLKTLK